MYRNQKVVVVVPARNGSKRLPGKNTKLLAGKPLIAYAIGASLGSKYADRMLFSTDSQEIADLALECGIAPPVIMRPSSLATDEATMTPVMRHVIEVCDEGGFHADIIVFVQPTNPFVISEDIDGAIKELIDTGANSCITVCNVIERPEWIYRQSEDKIVPVFPCNYRESRVQDLPSYWRTNCSVYVNRRDVIMSQRKVLDFNNLTGVMVPRDRFVDIDEPLDFIIAEAMMTMKTREVL